jgi:ribosome-binding protein aMBF1 (putative translation factor)
MDHQDWDQVYVWANKLDSKKTEKEAVKGKSKEQKIDDKIEAGNFSHQKMDANYGKKIQRARLEKKMTQKDLALLLNTAVKNIIEIENGKAQHNGRLMNLLNNKLLNIHTGKEKNKR